MSDNTITIQGNEYNPSDLPPEVLQLVSIYKKWQQDVLEARMEVSKTEAALREVSREIVEKVKDIKPVATEATEETPAAAE